MTDGSTPAFLESLNDSTCREILGALDGEAKSVREVSDECDIPLSTAYRKVNQLQDAALVEEEVLVNDDKKPLSIYRQRFDAAVITADDGVIEVEFVHSTDGEDFSPTVETETIPIVEGP